MQLMTRSVLEILQHLKDARDVSVQALILHTIKNVLSGHELRKIEYIRAGLLPALETLLKSYLDTEEWNASAAQEDAVWFHAASIVAVIANSGTAFSHPILHSDLVSLLLSKLETIPRGRLELSILRCLTTVADNLPHQAGGEWVPDKILASLLYRRDTISRLARVLDGEKKTYQQQQTAEAMMDLICKTCTTDRQKQLLVDANILNMLCNEIERFVSQQERLFDRNNQIVSTLRHAPSTAEHVQHISLVLETLSLIIQNSEAHAKAFVTHDGLLAPTATTQHSFDTIVHLDDPGIPPTGVRIPLPAVPDLHSLNAAKRSPFPPLSATSMTVKRRTSSIRIARDQNNVIIEDDDQDEQGEYLIVRWLLYVVRTTRGRRRLAAARLLGILKCQGLMHPVRSRSLSSLLVPILVDFIDDRSSSPWLDNVPATLALVVRDNEYLQNAAVETKAIPKLAAALKASFEPSQDAATDLWWPQKLDIKLTQGDPGCCLGPGGASSRVRRKMLRREGILQALASLAPDNESYRAEIVDQGTLVHIMQALEPFHTQIVHDDHGDTMIVHGNSDDTIIAACGTVRALTRSATALRTKLVDADVAKPIIQLLHTGEPEVRVATTMVIANLAHDFSPMKQSIEPIMKKLCEQAHSANARLRHESLFALKALVNNSKNELKRKIVDELGPNWIKHLIATDPHDVPAGEVIGLTPREYRKGSMIRVSDDAAMDLDSMDENTDPEEYSVHTLQQDLDIQAELLGFLRNLTTGDRPDEIIDYLFEHIGEDDFMHILVDRLKAGTIQRPMASKAPPAIIFNCLYILAHLCSADRKYRQSIYQNILLMRQASALLGHNDAYVRRAACWLVTNLVYPNTNESMDTLIQRARELQKLGIVNQIRRMEKTDPVTDVKERAATASECFNKLLSTS